MIAYTHDDTAREIARLTGWDLDAYAAARDWSGVAIDPCGVHRDSDALDRANHATATATLDAAHARYTVPEFGHWAVGWMREIALDSGDASATRVAAELREQLESYPVLDDDAYSALEWSDNHPDGTAHGAYCYADADAECHATDSLSRIVPRRDARGRFCTRYAWDTRR